MKKNSFVARDQFRRFFYFISFVYKSREPFKEKYKKIKLLLNEAAI